MLRQACRGALRRRARLPAQAASASRHLSSALQLRRVSQSQSRLLSAPLLTRLGGNVSARRDFSDLPEHIELGMPALSPTMEAGTIAEWSKKPGDVISAGDVLAQVETDKATVAFESVEDGYMAKILVAEGTADVPVGTPICVMVEEEGDVAAFANYEASAPAAPAAPATPTPAAPAAPAAAPAAPAPAAAAPVSSGSRVLASPAARRVARERSIDVSAVSGTGGAVGRVTSGDVLTFTPAAATATTTSAPAAPAAAPAAPPTPASGDFMDITNTNIKKVTAARLTESKASIPHYYVSMECRMDSVLSLRAKFNEGREKKERLSVNDFIIKASALALQAVPDVNASWMDTFVRQYNYVDISVAVATPTGLITPIVADADIKGLDGISSTVKELAGRAQEGKLQPNEFMGGTFTISNLGMFGTQSFSAIINPPQAAILAVGTTSNRLVSAPKGSDEPYESASFMTVTLSCDHRVIDGAVAARWLQAFKGYVEDPMKMLL